MPTNYRIPDLDIEGHPVIYTMPSGQEVEGYLAITARGRRIYRVYTDSPRRRQSEDLPSFSTPALWRPLYIDKWPDELPPPAIILEAPERAVEASPQIEQIEEPDGWPYPGLVLTLVKPASKEEAEARVLRGIRTSIVLERLDDRPSGDTAWPPALLFKARRVAAALRASRSGTLPWLTRADYADFHVDKSDLRALPSVWIPTRRDVGDVENGVLLWLNALTDGQSTVVHMRAASPQYSWRAIQEFNGNTSVAVVKKIYSKAIDAIWERATA